jgi:quinol monooxygenase YgiN
VPGFHRTLSVARDARGCAGAPKEARRSGARAAALRDTRAVATAPEVAVSESVVRVSQGFFAPHLATQVAAKLEAERATLDPALRRLPGLLHYYVALDPVSNSMVNVSVWASLDAAQQMQTLPEMLAQRDIFIELGVRFEPIRNYPTLWSIVP